MEGPLQQEKFQPANFTTTLPRNEDEQLNYLNRKINFLSVPDREINIVQPDKWMDSLGSNRRIYSHLEIEKCISR